MSRIAVPAGDLRQHFDFAIGQGSRLNAGEVGRDPRDALRPHAPGGLLHQFARHCS